jgi:hypothetical protein
MMSCSFSCCISWQIHFIDNTILLLRMSYLFVIYTHLYEVLLRRCFHNLWFKFDMLSFYTFFLFINGTFLDNVHMFQLMFSHLCWIRMILKYLIPVKLSIGILPEDQLLEKYGLVEVCLPLQFFLLSLLLMTG